MQPWPHEFAELLQSLEALVDKHGLPTVLDYLSIICSGKSDHVMSNWQDEKLSKVWDAASNIIDTASARPNVLRTWPQ